MKKLTYITYLLSIVGMYFGLMNQAVGQNCPTNPTPPMPSQYCVDSANFPINILGTHINWYSDNQLPTPGLNDPVLSTMVQAGNTYWIIYADSTIPSAPGLNTTTTAADCGTAQEAIAVTFVMRGTPPTLPNGGLVCANPATGCFSLNSVPGIFNWYVDPMATVPLVATGGCVAPGTYYATIQDANGCETNPAMLTVRAPSASPGSVSGYFNDTTAFKLNGCYVFCPDPIVGGINLDTIANSTTFATPPVDVWYEDSLLTIRARGINGPGIYYGVNISGQCASAPICIIVDDVPTPPLVSPLETCVPFGGIPVSAFTDSTGGPSAVADGRFLNWYTDAGLTTQIHTAGDTVDTSPYACSRNSCILLGNLWRCNCSCLRECTYYDYTKRYT